MNISRRELWILFSLSAFPIHIWTFISFFRDFSWISERSNLWDAIGVGAYSLLIALIESILVFLPGIILFLILPSGWDNKKRIAFIGVITSIISGWAIAGQLYYFTGFHCYSLTFDY